MKFCPNCAGMEIFRNNSGIDQCRRCNFIGEMREGGIDEINAVRKRIMITKNQPAAETKPSEKTNPLITNRELNQRLEKLKEKKSDDFESV
ncbi:MAG: hypothetical protein PHD95_05790 [Candidatus ainarchaeum sp.]|nr:hypothetical protein [Candidatus ainarchaeum sp.]